MSVSHATYGAARSVFSPSPAWKGKTGKEKYAGGDILSEGFQAA